MATTERTTIHYKINNLLGGPWDPEWVAPEGEEPRDEPARFPLVKLTRTERSDGRGKRWGDTDEVEEVIAELTTDQLVQLIKSGVEYLSWVASVTDSRARHQQ